MGDDAKTAGLSEKFGILELIDRGAGKARPEPAKPPVPLAVAEPDPPIIDDHPPLPVAGSDYQAYSRMSSRPVPCLFFLTKTMLPNGFLYNGLERVYMLEGDGPGAAPRLVVRFNGSEAMEIVIEGRNLVPLCMAIGRMVICWIWELPADQAAGDDAATVVRSITIRRVGE